MATQLMIKTPENIRQTALASLQNGQALLNKSYLTQLEHYNPMLLTKDDKLSYGLDTRLYKIECIVLENKQSTIESLTAAYTALGSAGYSVFLFLKSDGIETDIYLGVRGEAKKMMGDEAGKLVDQVFKGHFSGSQLTSISNKETERLMFGLNQINKNFPPAVTAVTGVPSLSVAESEFFIQGLEKFIDAVEGRCYQALILAEPVGVAQLNRIQLGYESVATQLSPLLKQSLSFGENESESIGLSIGESINQSFSTSLSLTETKGTNESISNTSTTGKNESTTDTFTTSKNESYTIGTSFSETSPSLLTKGISIGGPLLGGAKSLIAGLLGKTETFSSNSSRTTGTSTSESHGTTRGTSTSESKGTTYGSSYNKGVTKGSTSTNAHGETYNQSVNNTLGSNRQISLEIVDKSIEQLLKQVDHQLERVAEAHRYGGWQTAAYFIGDSTASSHSIASVFLGLMRGENSNSENFALTTWNSDKSKMLLPWLCNLTHPRLISGLSKDFNIPYFTPATLVSTKEMAIQLGLPRRSTSAVTVIETQSFGRKVQKANEFGEENARKIHLGNIYHLWNEMKNSPISLNLDQLASHVFVTGSTGSGKSNTVYQLLNELDQHKIPFMVIEPAKGEYKHVFGHYEDVSVFGTNPLQAQLLKINPFKFPNGIHVLEHIDRLIEIFNVCWPMYAAMPAILKDAMLNAYETSGWDLTTSCNSVSDSLFPSFIDLLGSLEKVINSSAYSDEMKSNYIGSLVTRVRSLTNGLNGQIFSANEIDNTVLFDSKVIIDLSRVGSQETKSLIMGILVMRLSEHRMSNTDGMNQPLKHVTVLEEAHNILKRTSSEQSNEGSNVAGKAVEMLSNAIAEMRTYGEGFIIADQSPSAVDISAIRNTNTKIIMRLPDEADRQLAGKSAGVKDEQLEEIAKLAKGVAVVYQNDWLEPVLCKIEHFMRKEDIFQYHPSQQTQLDRQAFNLNLSRFLLHKRLSKPEQYDLKMIRQGLDQFKLPTSIKLPILQALNEIELEITPTILMKKNEKKLSELLVSILNVRHLSWEKLKVTVPFELLTLELDSILEPQLGKNIENHIVQAIKDCVVQDFSEKNSEYGNHYLAWSHFHKWSN